MRNSMLRLLAAFLITWGGIAPSFAAGPSGGASGSVSSYIGLIASNGGLQYNFTSSANQFQTTTAHKLSEDIVGLQYVFWNGYVDTQASGGGGGLERGPGAATTLQFSIQSAIGQTPIAGTWNGGQATVSAPNLGIVVSDVVPFVGKRGQTILARQLMSNTAGIMFSSYYDVNPALGEGSEFGATVTNKVMSSALMNNANVTFLPAGLIGITSRGTAVLLDDSRGAGTKANEPAEAGFLDKGQTAPSLGAAGIAYSNFGIPSEMVQTAVQTTGLANGGANNFAMRLALLNVLKPTAVTVGYGINDYRAGRTGVQVAADTQTLINLLPPTINKIAQITAYPDCSFTSGSFTNTPASAAQNTQRIAGNNLIRRRQSRVGYIIDVDAIVSGDTLDSGVYGVAADTTDGLHLNTQGKLRVRKSNVVPVAYLGSTAP